MKLCHNHSLLFSDGYEAISPLYYALPYGSEYIIIDSGRYILFQYYYRYGAVLIGIIYMSVDALGKCFIVPGSRSDRLPPLRFVLLKYPYVFTSLPN